MFWFESFESIQKVLRILGRLIVSKDEINQSTKVSFFLQCSKMQLIPLKKFNIQTCFFQFLWFFRLKCWFKGQIISRIHLSLPNAYKLMCFDRNINGNRDVKFFEWDQGDCREEARRAHKIPISAQNGPFGQPGR